MTRLADFLQRNTIQASERMPLVHTTSAYRMRSIAERDVVDPQYCDVFKEKLAYFFVGRPSYKFSRPEQSAKHWELPCCFIFDFSCVKDIKRIFPFDSGAFDRQLYPSYISALDLKELEVSTISDAPERLIGAFFGSKTDYFDLVGKSKEQFEIEFSPTVFENEIQALNALALEGSSTSFDDRRFAIEIQSTKTISLSTDKPMAVVAPSIYFDDATFANIVTDTWKAQPIMYRMSSLSIDQYYGQIYEKIYQFYKSIGVL